jgi:Protein of unknown function (DUF2844)
MKIKGYGLVAVLLGLACAPQFAGATLGQGQTTVETDRMNFGAARQTDGAAAVTMRAAVARAFSVQEMVLTDGTAVREYVNGAGVVFGVAWEGMSIPPLGQLLGGDLLAKTRAAFETVRATHGGRGPVSVETSDVVFHSGGHPQAFFGNAYLPQLMPAGVSPADIH